MTIPDYAAKPKVFRVLRVEQPGKIFFDIPIEDGFELGTFIAMAKQLGHIMTPSWYVPMDQIFNVQIVTFTSQQPNVLVGIPVEGKPN